MGTFASIENMALKDALEAERQRKADEAQFLMDKKQEVESQAESEGGLIAAQQRRHPNAAMSDRAAKAQSEWAMLNKGANDRLDARALKLAVPGPTAAERYDTMLGPARDIAYMSPIERSEDLANNARGRLAKIEAAKNELMGGLAAGGASDEPIFYRGPAGGAKTDPRDEMLYGGAFEKLQGASVPRAAIRKEFGGTADDQTREFTNRPEAMLPEGWHPPQAATPEPGWREYKGGVGPRGGGNLSVITGGGKYGQEKDAVIKQLNEEADVARRAPLSATGTFAGLAKLEPEWDKAAAGMQPGDLQQALNDAVGNGELAPELGRVFRQKYDKMARDATDQDGNFSLEEYQQRITNQRRMAPGETEQRVKEGGGVAQKAEADMVAMRSQATGPVPGAPGVSLPPPAPGTTPPPRPPGAPPVNAAQAPMGPGLPGFGQRAIQGIRSVLPTPPPNTGTPEQPREVSTEVMRKAQREQLAMLARLGVPAAALMAGPTAWLPYLATAFASGAIGEAAGEGIEGSPLSPTAIGEAGATNLAFGGLAKGVGAGFRAVNRFRTGMRGSLQPAGVRSLGNQSMLDETAGGAAKYGALADQELAGSASTQAAAAPRPSVRGISEEAGAPGKASSLEQARQFQAQEAAGVTPPPEGNIPYFKGNLPARGGGNAFEMGPGTASSPADELLAEFTQGRTARAPRIEGPLHPLEGEVLPPRVSPGQTVEGQIIGGEASAAPEQQADAMIRQLLGSRGQGEGAKQLVRVLQQTPPEARASLLDELRAGLLNRRQQGLPVTARDTTELLAMMMRAGG